ncbi:MAG: SDR family NAD(P)-dependent oxidoreductase, partial [Myxococcota bacterium]
MLAALKKIAVIGASGGIGRALLESLAKEGHTVVACARTQPEHLPAGAATVFV